MPPDDADFNIEIAFLKGEQNARRVFDCAIALIEGFAQLDRVVASTIEPSIESVLVLEDIEAGSIKIWLRTVLRSVEDDALKTLDWKPVVGKYLLRAKYLALEFLDREETAARPSIDELKDAFQRLARETDLRHLPDYPAIHEARLIPALDRIQSAKRPLIPGDRLIIESNEKTYEVDLSKTWIPSTVVPVSDTRETISEGEIILTIRKPDFIKDTMWSFQHGRGNIQAPILDEIWLADFHARKVAILPGDALRAQVKNTYIYDSKGALVEQKLEILRVIEVIKGAGSQDDLPLA